MSNLTRLKAFGSDWCERLRSNAKVTFEYAEHEECYQTPQAVADNFVARFGFPKIGYNWEMLDSSVKASGNRAATNVLKQAFEHDLVMPGSPWLGTDLAIACATQFVDAFRPQRRTILSNRYDGLWNPISTSVMEFAFVGFDDRKIALLLVHADD